MKLPKAFVPEKDLEKKTEELLKRKYVKFKGCEIESEAEELFPNFIGYLKKHYKTFIIIKTQEAPKRVWPIIIPKNKQIGWIEDHQNQHSGTTEHGYYAVVELNGINVELKYRDSFEYFSNITKNNVKRKLPLRYDNNKEVPFP